MKILRFALIALALVGLIAVAGCGGDDEETSTTETTADALSVEDYAADAQVVLIDFGTQFQKLGSQISASGTPEEFAGLVDEAEAEIQGAIDDYGAIQPPEEAQEGHDQILAALEDFSSKLTDVSDAATSGDETALQDAAASLQEAGIDFQTQLEQAAQSLSDAGVDLQGPSSGQPTG